MISNRKNGDRSTKKHEYRGAKPTLRSARERARERERERRMAPHPEYSPHTLLFLRYGRDEVNARFVVQVDGYDLRAVDVTGRDDLVCNHTTVDPVQFVWNAETTHEEKHSALHGLAKRARERGSDEIIFHTNLKETTYQNGIASDAAERQRQFQEALERIEGLYCSRERAKECLAFFLERLTKDKDAEDLEITVFKVSKDEKEAVCKALLPNVNLEARLCVPWVDYTEEEREAMLETATPILYDDRKAAEKFVDEMMQRAKELCS